MTTKKATKVKETKADPATAASGESALSVLKTLAAKKPAPSASSAMLAQTTDPAIAGAYLKKGKSSVAILGFDPAIAGEARVCAELKEALEIAASNFKTYQGAIRDYGAVKRDLYNSTFKADVTTVAVPFEVEVPHDPESATPGRETRYVQVVCQNRYSVEEDIVLANKEQLGDWFPVLFNEDKKKILKPNAEELFRGILREQGIDGEALESAMGVLFDEHVDVSTKEDYESKEKEAPEAVRVLLSQAVSRVQPSLRFPDSR